MCHTWDELTRQVDQQLKSAVVEILKTNKSPRPRLRHQMEVTRIRAYLWRTSHPLDVMEEKIAHCLFVLSLIVILL